ncbi:MAG: hypothetical protein C5B57_09090, partial [Blastocatellia bacterium]
MSERAQSTNIAYKERTRTKMKSDARVLAAAAVFGITVVAGSGGTAQVHPAAPVTEASLENPDPADWLNWRRTRDGWGYSPLDQIRTTNANELQL